MNLTCVLTAAEATQGKEQGKDVAIQLSARLHFSSTQPDFLFEAGLVFNGCLTQQLHDSSTR